jgi:inhibitor of KinA
VIRPFGESGMLVELESPERAQAVAAALAAASLDGVVEVVPGLRSVLVELDPSRAADPSGAIEALAANTGAHAPAGRQRTIPVVYGGEHGPDLDEVAELCGISPSEVIELHAAVELRVLFDGFAPGFAYLGELPGALRVPRLATPRTRTPAGAVAIADAMSGIYPAELPGGWRVIGRTPVTLFDPRRDPPAYLVAGDRVRFEPIPASALEARSGAAGDWE